MRMHTHGKCSPNIILGAITIFCMIVLYNYWTLSTFNRELILKVHNLEQQAISLSKTNDALQVNLEKVEEIKEKVETNLKREIIVDQKAKEEITLKETKIKSLQNDLENSKQATSNCRDDLTSSDSKLQGKEKEVADLKSKVTSLEAQLVEKGNKFTRTEKELKETKLKLAEKVSGSSTQSTNANNKAPVIDVAHQNEQAVLINDPAVPYPNGWMDSWRFSKLHQPSKIHVSIINEGNSGIQRHDGPVLIFDNPKLPRAKARFSVMDRPKNEMKPDAVGSPPVLKQPDSIQKPQVQGDLNNGGEDLGPAQGVLPVPGAHNGHDGGAQNLDAAEDDGDRPLKDDFGIQDDQSPDGALSQKELNNGALQAPESMKHHNENLAAAQQGPLPFDNNL